MSEVLILVKHKGYGFCDVSVDGKYCGTIEDPDECLVADTLKRLVELIPIENTKVMESRAQNRHSK